MSAVVAAEAASAGRRLAESLMTSTCTIRSEGDGEFVTDPETGEVTEAAGTVAYAGKCRVRPASLQAQARQIGGDETFTSDVVVSVPFSASAVRKGMLVTVDSSPDAALVGLRVEVQDVARGDSVTARRLWCREVS